MDAARLRALITVAGGAQASAALRSFGAQVAATQKGLDRGVGMNLAKGATSVASGLKKLALVAGPAIGVALGYATKQFIDMDDALAGVRKTVTDLSDSQFSTFGKDLKALSTRIPVKFTDLASIAQEAGALGVKGKDVEAFTETVARLSAATVGLTTDAAAEAFGKFGNIFDFNAKGKDPKVEYQKMGSALIELGNNAASSESDIVAVTTRFAAAGQKAGLSIPQILGFSSAIASLGVEPEAAGGAMSRVFNKITTYIGTGDSKIKAFAKATGMSVREFSDYFKRDASGAIQSFLTGLSKLDKFQGAALLKEGGLTNVRDVNVITLLSLRHAELARQIGISTEAYDKNQALMEVSAKRFDTLKNKLTQFHNLIQISAAAVGEGLAPALGRLLVKASAFVQLHQGDMVNLGKDIGNAIDGIDWSKVETGAEAVASAVGKIADLIAKVPPQISLAVAGFLALNKVSGGAVGDLASGAADLGKGALGALLRAGKSILPGPLGAISGAAGGLLAQPVFVTNWPLGFGGGLPGAVPGAAGGAGFMATLAPLIAPALAVAAVGATAYLVNQGIQDQGAGLTKQSTGFASTATDADLKNAIDGVSKTIADMGDGPLSNPFNQKGIAIDQLNILIAEMNRRQTSGDHRYSDGPGSPDDRDQRHGGVTQGGFTADFRKGDDNITQGGFDKRFVSLSHSLLTGLISPADRAAWAHFATAMKELKSAVTPAQAIKAAKDAVAIAVTGHRGNAAGTAAMAADIKALLRHTTDPAARRILQDALRKVEAKLPGRLHAEEQVKKAGAILDSSKTVAQKLRELNVIEHDLKVNHPSKGAARTVQHAIDTLKADEKTAQAKHKADIVASQKAAAAAIVASQKAQQMSFTINPQPFILNVDGRAIISATSTAQQFTRQTHPGDGGV